MKFNDNGFTFNVGQSLNDLKKGFDPKTNEFIDFSRISAYSGSDKGIHTGANSQTKARHGQPFENRAKSD